MTHSRPILLQQAVGYLATNCTTDVMVSANASLTWLAIPPQLSSSTLSAYSIETTQVLAKVVFIQIS